MNPPLPAALAPGARAWRVRAAAVARAVARQPETPVVAGGVLGAAAMIDLVGRTPDSPRGPGASLSIALLLGLFGTVPLAFAREYVLPVALTVTAATTLALTTDYGPSFAGLVAQAVVAYLVGRHRSWRLAGLVVVPFVAAAVAPLGGDRTKVFVVVLAALVGAAAGLGAALRGRQEAARRHASRRALADSLLEHAARGERARIARELHDVVAHHISMIAVQAETARLTTPGMPPEGAKRLVAIGDTARSALSEMRRLLGVLREDAGGEPSRRPQPGLEQLNGLLDEARESSGAYTRLILRGRVVPLEPGVELTAYRIVQEALTNARRHAPGAAVDVELEYGEDALRLRVRDCGPGPDDADPAAGHGLLGMRERAAAVGGTLSTGPGPSCGFLVEAILPTTPAAT